MRFYGFLYSYREHRVNWTPRRSYRLEFPMGMHSKEPRKVFARMRRSKRRWKRTAWICGSVRYRITGR